MLVGSSVLAAVLSEILVGAVEGTGEALGLSTAFLGIVLLASVGGVAEGMSAVTMARKGRFDLSLGIALGSCILIALFVAPVLVFASYFVGPRPSSSFSTGGVGLLFLAVLIGAFVASSGSALVQGRAVDRRLSDDRAAALLRAALSGAAALRGVKTRRRCRPPRSSTAISIRQRAWGRSCSG